MKYPRDTVWYVEARLNTNPGDAAKMGSAIVVRLYQTGVLTSNRKYLLTCGHLVRGSSQDNVEGWGALLGEYLCWRPGGSYVAPEKFPDRRSGNCPGALVAKIAAQIRPTNPNDVPNPDRRASGDWVLLDVQDETFQDRRSVVDLASPEDEDRLTIIGYPSGFRSWVADGAVESYVSRELSFEREADPGTIRVSGAYDTAPGVSGGGVFDLAGKLVGIHRSTTLAQLALTAVDAGFIKTELAALGWQVSPAPLDDLEGVSDSSARLGASVSHLVGMRGDAAAVVRNTLSPLKPRLEDLKNLIGEMQALKECHEVLLHRAGPKVPQCIAAIRAWQANSAQVSPPPAIHGELSKLKNDLLRFGDFAQRCAISFPAAQERAAELLKAMTDLEGQLRERKKEGADQHLRLVVMQIVSTMPSSIQGELGRLALRLPFTEIATALTASQLDLQSPGLDGLMELLPLQADIRRFVNEHLAWQELDRELRPLEGKTETLAGGEEMLVDAIKAALKDIAFMSNRVLAKVQKLQEQESSINEVNELLKAATLLQQMTSAANAEMDLVINASQDVRAITDRLFTLADERLLTACQRLGSIVQPLDALIRILP